MDLPVVARTRDAITKHKVDFVKIGEQAEAPIGYCDDSYFYLSSTMFAEIHGKSRQAMNEAADGLEQAGLLHRGGERSSYMFKMPTCIPSRPRMYRISRDILAPNPETMEPCTATTEPHTHAVN